MTLTTILVLSRVGFGNEEVLVLFLSLVEEDVSHQMELETLTPKEVFIGFLY